MAYVVTAVTSDELEVFGDYFSIDNKHIKSYATRAALAKALKKLGASQMYGRPLAVCNSAGRWAALIDSSTLHGNITAFPGFMKV